MILSLWNLANLPLCNERKKKGGGGGGREKKKEKRKEEFGWCL